MKRFMNVVLLFAFALGFAGCASAAEESIKIGYIATLTGEGATWGQHERDAAMLAVKEINEKGGLLGHPVELICYDIKAKPEEAVIAVRRMIDEGAIGIGGCNQSGIQLAIAPIIDKAQIPNIASTATNPAVTVDQDTGKVRPYTFRINFTDAYQGTVISDYLVRKLGAKKLAIIGDIGDAYSEGLTEYQKKQADKLGVEHKFWAFRGGDVDFRAQITEAKAWGAEAVGLTMLYKEMALVIKQAAEMGWTPYFMGGTGYSPNMFEIAGDAMEGTFWVYGLSGAEPSIQGLVANFEKEYGHKPTEPMNMAFGYDIIQMFAHAIKTAGEAAGRVPTRSEVRDAIENTKDLQVTHFAWTVDKETHNPLNKPGVILRGDAAQGKAVYLETWAPESK
ncbi:ABC transporter substrate-binding protein [Synergistales bacterium]|nr:ABC transporter substrate-binding protein [Synergistales bacterium]